MNATAIQSKPEQSTPAAASRREPYRVSVEQYRLFRQQGFLAVSCLVSPEEVAELRQHTDDLMQGRLPEQTQEMKDGSITSTDGRKQSGFHATNTFPVKVHLNGLAIVRLK